MLEGKNFVILSDDEVELIVATLNKLQLDVTSHLCLLTEMERHLYGEVDKP